MTKPGAATPAIAPALLALALLGAGCESVPPGGGGPSAARPVSDAPPRRVVPTFQTRDTDGNGRTDTVDLRAYLFPAPDASPLPVWADGEFRFTLTGQDEQHIASWTFPADQVRDHRGTDAYGPTHSFTLDVKAAAGHDDFPPQHAALLATFIRSDGVTISSTGAVGVPLGQ